MTSQNSTATFVLHILGLSLTSLLFEGPLFVYFLSQPADVHTHMQSMTAPGLVMKQSKEQHHRGQLGWADMEGKVLGCTDAQTFVHAAGGSKMNSQGPIEKGANHELPQPMISKCMKLKQSMAALAMVLCECAALVWNTYRGEKKSEPRSLQIITELKDFYP